MSADAVTGEEQAIKPVYKQWPGDNVFLCKGRLMSGPDWLASVATSLMVLLPMGFYFGLIGPAFADRGRSWVIVFEAILLVFMITMLILTTFSEPGIVPRRPFSESSPNRRPPRIQRLLVNGKYVMLKYCGTCNIYRPPRCSHCSICDSCVLDFDHHCPWIGNCIGRHNYRRFLVFLYACVFLSLWTLYTCVWILVLKVDERSISGGTDSNWSLLNDVLRSDPSPIILAIYTLIAVCFVVGLYGFHMYLVVVGMTTNEHLKGGFPHGSPYTRGWFWNCVRMHTSLDPEIPLFDPMEELEMGKDFAIPQHEEIVHVDRSVAFSDLTTSSLPSPIAIESPKSEYSDSISVDLELVGPSLGRELAKSPSEEFESESM